MAWGCAEWLAQVQRAGSAEALESRLDPTPGRGVLFGPPVIASFDPFAAPHPFASVLTNDSSSLALSRFMSGLRRACDLDLPAPCFQLGVLYDRMGMRTEAIQALLKNCAEGGSYNCAYLFHLKDSGNAGILAYTLECLRGNSAACGQAGDRLLPSAPQLAQRLFSRGCQLGDGPSCRHLPLAKGGPPTIFEYAAYRYRHLHSRPPRRN